MTTTFETWLTQATRHLSRDAAAQVRSEIREHYDAARENAMERGSSSEEADRVALEALGDAKAANRQYRKVMLTSGEARLLREGNWEAGAICSHAWLKWLLFAMPASALLAGIGFSFAGATGVARVLLVGGLGLSVLMAATVLPVYTPARGRVYRAVKWAVLGGDPSGCLLAGVAAMVVVAVLVRVADGVGGMDKSFDQAEAAGREVAEAVVSVIRSCEVAPRGLKSARRFCCRGKSRKADPSGAEAPSR